MIELARSFSRNRYYFPVLGALFPGLGFGWPPANAEVAAVACFGFTALGFFGSRLLLIWPLAMAVSRVKGFNKRYIVTKSLAVTATACSKSAHRL